MKGKILGALTLASATLGGAPASAAPANTIRELFANLSTCMKDVTGDPGEELTVAFSLKRDGSMLGKPHISYSKLPNDAAEQSRFIEGVAASFDKCLPTPITDGLGGAIAGRRLTLRFIIHRQEIRS